MQRFQHVPGFDRVGQFRRQPLRDQVVAAAHVEAFVAAAEDAERVLVLGADEGEEIQRRLLLDFQPHLGGIGHVEQLAQPAVHAIAVEPLGDAERIEFAEFRVLVGVVVVAIARGGEVALDRRRHRHEGAHDLGLADRAAIEEPGVMVAVAVEQVVEGQAEFAGQLADVRMPGVDQLAAEFDHLAIGEMVAQRQHAPADAVLRFVHAHAHAGLAQPPRRGQAGDAGADDGDFIVRLRAHRQRQRLATGQQCAGARRLQQATTTMVDALRARGIVEFVERHAHVARCAGDGGGALQQAEQRGAAHGWTPGCVVPDQRAQRLNPDAAPCASPSGSRARRCGRAGRSRRHPDGRRNRRGTDA